MAPPPFASKLYELVSEQTTNHIISWATDGRSFVVWNAQQLETELLPRHFKHRNFSSFIRQLHNYGFRKTDADLWAFSNENFQRNRPELLAEMHPRPPQAKKKEAAGSTGALTRGGSGGTAIELGGYGVGQELDQLKRDKNALVVEVVRLRQAHQAMSDEMATVQERLAAQERVQQQTLAFMQRALQAPGLLDLLQRSGAAAGFEQSDLFAGQQRKRRQLRRPLQLTTGFPPTRPGAAELTDLGGSAAGDGVPTLDMRGMMVDTDGALAAAPTARSPIAPDLFAHTGGGDRGVPLEAAPSNWGGGDGAGTGAPWHGIEPMPWPEFTTLLGQGAALTEGGLGGAGGAGSAGGSSHATTGQGAQGAAIGGAGMPAAGSATDLLFSPPPAAATAAAGAFLLRGGADGMWTVGGGGEGPQDDERTCAEGNECAPALKSNGHGNAAGAAAASAAAPLTLSGEPGGELGRTYSWMDKVEMDLLLSEMELLGPTDDGLGA